MENTNPTGNSAGKNKKIIKWAVILAIVVVLNLFFNYTISLLYKTPDYNAFCAPEVYNKQYYEKNSCNADGGMWTENTAPRDLKGKTPAVPVTLEVSGWCNPTYTCQKNFDSAHSVYNRNVFILLVSLGVLALAVGASLSAISVVSLGLSFGGVISLIIGAARYWSDMHDIIRVLVLAAALAALVWIGIRKFKE